MSDSEPVPTLLTIPEAAELLRVSEGWLARAAAKGTVPSIKHGGRRLFTPHDLTSYIEGLRRDPWARSPKSQAAVRTRRRAS